MFIVLEQQTSPSPFGAKTDLKDKSQHINLELIKEGVARYQAPPPYSMSNYTACVYRIAEKQVRQYGMRIWVQEQDREYAALGIQGSKFFRDKLGKPSELYRRTSGIDVKVDYDDKGQVCSVNLSDPDPAKGRPLCFPPYGGR
jgi:hypothetical protein